MGRKKQSEARVNLERWMVSYADFVTLLFATFVVLYALSQSDIKAFTSLEESIKQAFSAPSIMQGSDGVMNKSDSLFESSQGDSMISPLMMEYVSQKYEEQSIKEIGDTINEESKIGELNGVEAEETEQGLIIRIKNDYLFKPGSAELQPSAKKKLDKIGVIISKKFILHNMRVEGHTDNSPIKSSQYPSNWELSSARSSSVVRYFIQRFNFFPSLFTVIGFADTRPLVKNSSDSNKTKNRRVEIIILRNKFKKQESAVNEIAKMSKPQQEEFQKNRLKIINSINGITNNDIKQNTKLNKENAVIVNKIYSKETQRINKESNAFDAETRKKLTGEGDWLKPPAKMKSHIKEVKAFK